MIQCSCKMEKKIYIILSQTGTMFSRALKFFTKAEYNHASISLSPTLDEMYSFGRLNPYNPFKGGFVKEGKNIGTFKRFYNTKAMVIELHVTEEEYYKIKIFIEYLQKNQLQFHYNYWGIFLACFKKNLEPKKRFYCSQFVRACLAYFDIDNSRTLPKIIKPIDFMKLENKKIIYTGLLKDYFCS